MDTSDDVVQVLPEVLETPTKDPMSPLCEPALTSSPRLIAPCPSSAAISQPYNGGFTSSQAFMFPQTGIFPVLPQFPPPNVGNNDSNGASVTMETISQQIAALTQSVMVLSQKVNENQKLFEENIRLKDIVIDLEIKLKDANDRMKSVDALREAMTAQFAELNKSLSSRSNVIDDTFYYDTNEDTQHQQESSFFDQSYNDPPSVDADVVVPEPGMYPSLYPHSLLIASEKYLTKHIHEV